VTRPTFDQEKACIVEQVLQGGQDLLYVQHPKTIYFVSKLRVAMVVLSIFSTL